MNFIDSIKNTEKLFAVVQSDKGIVFSLPSPDSYQTMYIKARHNIFCLVDLCGECCASLRHFSVAQLYIQRDMKCSIILEVFEPWKKVVEGFFIIYRVLIIKISAKLLRQQIERKIVFSMRLFERKRKILKVFQLWLIEGICWKSSWTQNALIILVPCRFARLLHFFIRHSFESFLRDFQFYFQSVKTSQHQLKTFEI